LQANLVTVILPVRNGERHIGEQLAALAGQDYTGRWELVVVDNGSRDGTRRVVDRWTPRLPEVRVVTVPARGLNRARNAGVDAARGDFVAFCDADDVVAPAWLRALVDAGVEGAVVGGALDSVSLNTGSAGQWRPPHVNGSLSVGSGFLPFVPGGNCGMPADLARRLRFDPTFTYGGSDQEFSWRAHQSAVRLVHAPDALVHHRYRERLHQLAAQYFRYGSATPLLYRTFRGHGMPAPSAREAVAAWRSLLRDAPALLRGTARVRGAWVRTASTRIGRLAGSVRWRTFYP
jgi:glycosyltransferase involved in cell wall biosynthesis